MASGLPISIYDTMVVPDAEGWIEVAFEAPAESFWLAIGAEKEDATGNTIAYIDDISLRKGWIQDRKCPQPGSIFAKKGRYRWGFNGMEVENHIYNNGGYDFGARIYDGRSGRFLSVDPWVRKFPDLSPYQIANNTPIWAIDLDGLGWIIYTWYQVHKKPISGTTHKYVFEKMKNPEGRAMTSAVEHPEVSGTIFKNWYIYDNKLYQHPYEIPGYSLNLRAERERMYSIFKDALIIGGGVAVTIASFGSGTSVYTAFVGITSGSMAIVGGGSKLGLDLRNNEGDKEFSNKIPTGLIDGLVGVPLEGIATIQFQNEEVGRKIRFTTQIVDGVLDLRNLFNKVESTPDLIDKTFTITNLSIEVIDKIQENKKDK